MESERPAFEVHALRVGLPITRTNVGLAFANGVRMVAGDYFQPTQAAWVSWLAAKQHAKPLAVIKEVNYATRCMLQIPWYTVDGTCCRCEHQTREACEQWALANGYRLE